MADNLCDLDKHVEDHTLVLQVLRGLKKKYDHFKTYLKWAQLFPSFHDVHNDLLEELTLDAEASLASATTLAASGGQQQRPSTTPAQQCRSPSYHAPFNGPRPLTPPGTSGGDRGGGGGGSSGRGGDGSGRRHQNRSGVGGGGTGGGSSTDSTTTTTTGQSRGGTP
jgi:hypothetical protein